MNFLLVKFATKCDYKYRSRSILPPLRASCKRAKIGMFRCSIRNRQGKKLLIALDRCGEIPPAPRINIGPTPLGTTPFLTLCAVSWGMGNRSFPPFRHLPSLCEIEISQRRGHGMGPIFKKGARGRFLHRSSHFRSSYVPYREIVLRPPASLVPLLACVSSIKFG